MGGRLLFVLAALWLFDTNAADADCALGEGFHCQALDQDEDEALQLLQRAAARGRGDSGSGSQPSAPVRAGRLAQDAPKAPSARRAAADMGPVARGAQAVQALEVAQSAADREQWPDIEQMIRSVSSVVTQSADRLSSSLTSAFTGIEGLSDKLLKESRAAKTSLLQSVNSTSGKVEDRLSSLERSSKQLLDKFLQHFGPLDKELHTSSTVVTSALQTAGQGHLASKAGAAFGGVFAWAEACVATAGNVSEVLVQVGEESKGGKSDHMHQAVARLNATLDLFLDKVRVFVDSFEVATVNATESLVVAFAARLPGPAAAMVNGTLAHVRSAAKNSGKSVVQATQEVTSGIGQAYTTVAADAARGGSGRPRAGSWVLLAAALASVLPFLR